MLARWKDAIILLLLGAGLVHLSWNKWVNIPIDYGRELYIPWRITCGEVLYKDLASLFGPLPAYWNALLFKLFGVSIMTLVLFNILLVLAITVLIYKFFNFVTDKHVALFTSAAFLSLFAFQQSHLDWDLGNFSYICPYSYSVTYALFFSLWAMDIFIAYVQSDKNMWLGIIGILVGLTALCRFEIFLFLSAALSLSFIVKGIMEHWPLPRTAKSGAWLFAGFCIPVGIAYLYFATQLHLSEVFPNILGFNDRWYEILHHYYYRLTSGLNHPWHNSIIMLTTTAAYLLLIAAFKSLYVAADLFKEKNKKWQGTLLILLGLAIIVRTGIWILNFYEDGIFHSVALLLSKPGIFKGLPLVITLMACYLFWFLLRHPQGRIKMKQTLPLLAMSIWALLMFIKIILNVRINSLGFVYALPGVLLFIALWLYFMPRYFERFHPHLSFIKPLASLLVVLIFIAGLTAAARVYQSRQFQIRSGKETIIARMIPSYPPDAQIEETAAFLKDVDSIMKKDSNFAVFPQGAILNFLTQRTSSLPYNTFMFAELGKYGEQNILRSFKEHKPDYIVLSDLGRPKHYDTLQTYPFAIRAWILDNYHPVWPLNPKIDQMLMVYKRSE